MMITQLDSYYQAMSNSYAFSTIDNMYPYLDKIASKLGVDLNSNLNGGSFNKSYFNRQDNDQQLQQDNGGLAQQSGISFTGHSSNPFNSLGSLMK